MKFSVQEVDLTDEDPDFADAELWFLSDGNNAQNSPISTEVLKRDAGTFIGKPIVAKYDKWTQDVTSHVPDEVIVGWIPADSTIDFKEKDGKTFAVAHGIISKLYATDVYEMFKNHNYRSVSVEFSASQPDMNVYGEGEIVAIMGHGITILGETVAPCCKDANIQIKKFSLEEANDYYNSKNPLKRFADERKKEMSAKTIKINKDELKTTPWGDVDKEDLRKEVMDAKNKNTLVKSVYLIVEDGWEDAPSQHLKYPVMQIVDGTAYYNRDALASALGYAKKEGEDAVVKKVESLYHKFKLDKEEKDTDKDKKFTLVNIDRIYGSVWELVRQKYPDGEYGINGIYEENGNKFAVLNKYDDTTLYKLNFTINSDGNIEIADTIVETEMEFIDSKNVLKFEEPKDSKKFKEFEKKEGAKMQEDDKGLLVEGRLLIDDVPRAKQTHALMKAGVIDGLSIGYRVKEYLYNVDEEVTDLIKLSLREVSIVTFPANPETRIEAVKSRLDAGELPTLPEFEKFLREAGFSKSQATAIAGHGLRKLLSDSVPEAKSIQNALNILKGN